MKTLRFAILGAGFWAHYQLAAWCELRQGFRNFRIDRIEDLSVTSDRFEKVPGRTLADFVAYMKAHSAEDRRA